MEMNHRGTEAQRTATAMNPRRDTNMHEGERQAQRLEIGPAKRGSSCSFVCLRGFNSLSLCLGVSVVILALSGAASSAQVRIKDIAGVQGARSNQLVGYGLVIGLDGP